MSSLTGYYAKRKKKEVLKDPRRRLQKKNKIKFRHFKFVKRKTAEFKKKNIIKAILIG